MSSYHLFQFDSKVQNMMGGRVRICVTGAAPISKDVLNFMRCALGVYFTEGEVVKILLSICLQRLQKYFGQIFVEKTRFLVEFSIT